MATQTHHSTQVMIELSPELSQHLEELAETLHTSQSNIVRKAIALITVAAEAKRDGKRLFIGDEPPPGMSQEIVGL